MTCRIELCPENLSARDNFYKDIYKCNFVTPYVVTLKPLPGNRRTRLHGCAALLLPFVDQLADKGNKLATPEKN
jgi:hypothetical protein